MKFVPFQSALRFGAVLGDGPANPGRANLRLIRRAIRAGWLDLAPRKVKDAFIAHFAGALQAAPVRARIRAAWCVLEASKRNLRLDEEAARCFFGGPGRARPPRRRDASAKGAAPGREPPGRLV
jgi:hypothetical protein